MGITGLLPRLKNILTKKNIKDIDGVYVGVDISCWLHSAAANPKKVYQIVLEEDYRSIVDYCSVRLTMLKNSGKHPVVVFDGAKLPAKQKTNENRRKSRSDNLNDAFLHLDNGDGQSAECCLKKAATVTHGMVQDVIKYLQQNDIDYIVAPYEADAQLAYLALNGLVQIIITEDSDLILFGCPHILFKMNVHGNGDFFDASKLHSCFNSTEFDLASFRRMCILSGCDYLPSIRGIGLKTAEKAIFSGGRKSLEDILRSLKVTIPPTYPKEFLQAEQMFLNQTVFNVIAGIQVPLHPYAVDAPLEVGAGQLSDHETSYHLAIGNINPHTGDKVGDYCINPRKNGKSLWSQLSRSRQSGGFAESCEVGEQREVGNI